MDIKAVVSDDELQAIIKAHVEAVSGRFVVGRITIAAANPSMGAHPSPSPMALGQAAAYFNATCVITETETEPVSVPAIPAP